MSKTAGLVLSGGGARGAYQAGVLSAIQEISETSGIPLDFKLISGVSAGAINAGSYAANCDDPKKATETLTKLWCNLSFDQVITTDSVTMGKIGLQWMRELSLGGVTGTTPGRALLDTTPLYNLIHNNMNYSRIQKHIDAGRLSALCITAIDYALSRTTTFVQGHDNLPSWNKGIKCSERTSISTEHIMASASIPLLFPPIKIDDRYFGDGAIRNHAPCSPLIQLGADKILVIGVRLQATKTAYEERASQISDAPSVARVLNTIMNATLMDAIEQDIERIIRYNEYANALAKSKRDAVAIRPIEHLLISPSADIGDLAAQKAQRLPRFIRYLLKGLGSLHDASEIISYLMFEPSFCSDLIDIGRNDGLENKEEIIKFLLK